MDRRACHHPVVHQGISVGITDGQRALALGFLGEADEAVEWRQRACVAYGERGECDLAARLAAWMSH